MMWTQRRDQWLPAPDDPTLDPVTGLIDGPCLDRLIEEAVELAASLGLSVSLALIAPPSGAAARTVAELVSANLRSVDIVGRLRDGTFGLILDAPEGDALRAVSRLKGLLDQAFPGSPCSAGIATTSGRAGHGELLMVSASVALGRARQQSGGWIEVAADP